ncbi:nadp fad dependent oxidoreductase [Colletotrichum incanum]|uniref:NADPH--cytochrome P450 reductase n=1 Tax=Colletotrichum incanum TaxID=1573173 RepID=A0A166TAZ3_COLIC|nr:nadp fad dependent oxidoreductase [Colletotrichum incanum]OHW96605.1 NADPH-cytochrome p450 reductase [Colletotrichum incanum]
MSIPGALPENTLKLISQLTPSTVADTAALAAAGLLSAAYVLRGYAWDKPDPYDYIWYEKPQQGAGGNAANKRSRNVAERLEELGKDVVVFWGSQSGTAEGFANRLARELHQRFHLNTMSADLSDFDAETIAQIPQTKLAIFIISTYGEGDPSDNASLFWDWVTKLQSKTLTSLRYAAFGLGNSNYRYYNRVVDVVDKSLEDCGASRLAPVGRADDAQGATEEDFLSWKDGLFKVFCETLKLQEHEVVHEPSLSVIEDESLEPQDLHIGEPVHLIEGSGKSTANSAIKPLKIKKAYSLFSSPGRSCLHLDLDLGSSSQLTYKTGDHLAVWPINPDQEVERLLNVLGLSERRSIPISIKALDAAVKVRIPTPTNVETLFRYYLEICAAVPRDAVRGLAQFAPSSAAKEFLLNLGRDKDNYATFLASNHLTIGKLLELAAKADGSQTTSAWAGIPLSYLIETLPRSQPRYYSISSSSVVSPKAPSITVAVSDTPLSASPSSAIPGLTTNYLQVLSRSLQDSQVTQQAEGLSYALSGPSNALEGGFVYAHIRRSKFKLPMLSSHPLVMVAAGTGLAPFRAFITERMRLQSIGKDVGQMILFFGCQRPDDDYIYKEELEQMEKDLGGKLKIVTAFSRQEGTKKVYVQDKVREFGSDVMRLLEDGASLYMCGRASMAREVGKTLGDIVGADKEWSDAQVKEWSEGLKRNRKWQEDVWG